MRPIPIETLRRFASAQDGATAIEYALIACGIAGALVVVITAIGGSVSAMYQAIADAFGS
jgi:pilus assembly protein Flp/PilA